jgi:hypothetical protein
MSGTAGVRPVCFGTRKRDARRGQKLSPVQAGDRWNCRIISELELTALGSKWPFLKLVVVRCEQMIPVEVTDFCDSGPLSTDASD